MRTTKIFSLWYDEVGVGVDDFRFLIFKKRFPGKTPYTPPYHETSGFLLMKHNAVNAPINLLCLNYNISIPTYKDT